MWVNGTKAPSSDASVRTENPVLKLIACAAFAPKRRPIFIAGVGSLEIACAETAKINVTPAAPTTTLRMMSPNRPAIDVMSPMSMCTVSPGFVVLAGEYLAGEYRERNSQEKPDGRRRFGCGPASAWPRPPYAEADAVSWRLPCP